MLLELRCFEPRRNTPRLLGRSSLTREIGSPDRPAAVAADASSELLEGRRGYGVVWDFSATYE